MLCDIVVPIYGALSFLKRCVNAVLGSTRVPFLLWLINDCSPEESGVLDYLEGIRDQRVRAYSTSQNLGFGQTCNKGVSLGKAPFICLLNSDTEVQLGWLSAMLANMGNSRVAMVGAKLIYPPLITQTDGRHKPGRIQHAGLYFGADKLPHEAFLNYRADHYLVNRRIYVSAVTHACVLIRRSTWKQGYDPRYQKGAFEDVDMCLDFTHRGLLIVYEPEAVIWHYQGASYDHSESYPNLVKLLKKWQGKIKPDFDIYVMKRPNLDRPAKWWEEEP